MSDDLTKWFQDADGFCQGTKSPHKWVLQANAALHQQSARIRELEAEVAALREARGVRVKPMVWEDWSAKHRTNHTADTPFGRYGVMQFHFPDMHFKIEPPTAKPFIADTLDAAKAAAQADYERRILAALEPAPVTVGEAVRDDAKTALAHLEAVEDAYTRWMLAHAVGDADLIHRDSNALSNALFTMFNSDPNDGPSEVTRALADAGEAGV